MTEVTGNGTLYSGDGGLFQVETGGDLTLRNVSVTGGRAWNGGCVHARGVGVPVPSGALPCAAAF